ncbi:MAG: ATP phosphoribosyltransferase regulatory subunit, partial [Oscillospiraceae bacterium]
MKVKIECPRGTKDVLPAESYKWSYVEKVFREQARIYGVNEIRVPMFEHTELFQRGVGDTTDVVQKEMYTFEDKKGRSITLRPELTAGTARSIIQNGLLGGLLPLKAFYIGSCFRYEKAQTGRYREFHQFGVEMFGAKGPLVDAELISLASSVFEVLGVKDIELQINSIGCKECRKKYHQALREYFSQFEDRLCPDCK